MIPTEAQAKALWDKYDLPRQKRLHATLVAQVAVLLAERCQLSAVSQTINIRLLSAAALLHDIDKNVSKLPGEQHPDAAVRILRKEGMDEVAALVATHPLHAILDPLIAPKTWEEKLLYLADKMVKYKIITVDERFRLWNREHLPTDAQRVLDASYPKVKELEREIFALVGLTPEDIRSMVTRAHHVALLNS